jgi:hypothetical protein
MLSAQSCGAITILLLGTVAFASVDQERNYDESYSSFTALDAANHRLSETVTELAAVTQEKQGFGGGGLADSTCAKVGSDISASDTGIHKFIQLELARQQQAMGDYKCLAAWTEVTSEPTAWVLCTVGTKTYAAQVMKNGPLLRKHVLTDPNAATEPVFSGGSTDPVLNDYFMAHSKASTQFDDTIPARVQAAVPGASPSAAAQDDTEELDEPHATGLIFETAQELAAMPELAVTEEQLASVPSTFDVRSGLDCLAFKRFNQGTCGSCWAWAVGATYSAKLCWVTKGAVNIDMSEESLLDCSKSGGYYTDPGKDKYLINSLRQASRNSRDLCNGGNFVSAFDTVLRKGGVVDRKCNPYEAKWTPHSCGKTSSSCRKWGFGKDKKSYVVKATVNAIKAAVYIYGPAYVGIPINKGFHKYRGGLYENCGRGSGGHAMAIFGYGRNCTNRRGLR